MGEQQLDVVTSDDLFYVPVSEFQRLRAKRLAPLDEARTFASLARINTLYMIARAWSGHIGTSFSSLEIVSWLFLQEIKNLDQGPKACDVFFSSKGHDAPALYTVLIALGLLDADKLHQLRRLHGLPGHPHVETPYIQANTGSLGMGISKAKGMALANRLLGTPQKIFVLTGDGELQEGQFWESLQSAANLGLHEITAIIDHNKIQSDTWVEEVSDLGGLEAKLRAFGWHVERVDGHDIAALQRVFRELDGVTDKPKAIVADTVKGKGVSFMEGPAMKAGELYNYHSGAPNEQEYASASTELMVAAQDRFRMHGLGDLELAIAKRPARKPVLKVERLVFAYTQALLEQAERCREMIALDADLVKDCGLVDFRARFPERFVECGIAEQDMVSMACGMAHRGALPVVHSFACFLTARPNEQIYNQCSESSKVIYVGSLAGLLPGGPGHSHQSVRDISALGAVPKLILAEPCTEQEVKALFDYMVNGTSESSYLRLVSLGWPVPFALPSDYRAELGRGVTVRDGTDAVVFGYGPWLLANAWEASERLAVEDVSVKLVNLPWLNRLESRWLRDVIGPIRQIVTLDNHYVHGGQGDMIAARIAELGLTPACRVTRVGVTELPECGTNDEVLQHHQLDIEGLFDTMQKSLGAPVAPLDLAPRDLSRASGSSRATSKDDGAPGCPEPKSPLDEARDDPEHPEGSTDMIGIFWDIDGTLLTTGRAGIFAWEDACREVTGHALDFQTLETDGLTDHQVALKIFEQAGQESTDASLTRMVQIYESRLPERLHTRKGRALDRVRDILLHLRAHRPDVHSMLLTGNTSAGARAKLTHYELQEFFEGGAFSQDQGPRAGIASRALAAIRAMFPDAGIEAAHLFVVGDTPHDIDCAQAIGARTIAVASGVYGAAQLQAHGAWRVVDSLPSPLEFEALIDLPVDSPSPVR